MVVMMVKWDRGWALALAIICLQIQGSLFLIRSDTDNTKRFSILAACIRLHWLLLKSVLCQEKYEKVPKKKIGIAIPWVAQLCDSITACCSRPVYKLHRLLLFPGNCKKTWTKHEWLAFSTTGNFPSLLDNLHAGENMSRHSVRWRNW